MQLKSVGGCHCQAEGKRSMHLLGDVMSCKGAGSSCALSQCMEHQCNQQQQHLLLMPDF